MLALAFSLVLGPATGAGAQEADLLASQGAWFWSSNSSTTVIGGGFQGTITQDNPGSASGIGVTEPGTVSPISTGHLGVSLKNGSSDMRSYLKFDFGELTADLPFGMQLEFSSFVVRLSVSHPTDTEHGTQHSEFSGKPPATTNDRAAAIVACAVSTAWGPAAGEPPSNTTIIAPEPRSDPPREDFEITSNRNEPMVNCGHQAVGKAVADGRVWTFDITDIANKWASLEVFNEGIALLPSDESLASTWTVEFHGPETVLNQDGEDIEVVTKGIAARAEIEFDAVPMEEPTGGPGAPGPAGPAGPAGPTVIPPPVTDDGGSDPPPSLGGTIVLVGRSGSAETPAWLYGLVPLGLLALGLTASAVGTEGGSAGLGSRVAHILRERRLNDLGRPTEDEPLR